MKSIISHQILPESPADEVPFPLQQKISESRVNEFLVKEHFEDSIVFVTAMS